MAMALAPHLMANERVEVVYDAVRLDPDQNITYYTGYQPLSWQYRGTEDHAKVRIIEWIKAEKNALHL